MKIILKVIIFITSISCLYYFLRFHPIPYHVNPPDESIKEILYYLWFGGAIIATLISLPYFIKSDIVDKCAIIVGCIFWFLYGILIIIFDED